MAAINNATTNAQQTQQITNPTLLNGGGQGTVPVPPLVTTMEGRNPEMRGVLWCWQPWLPYRELIMLSGPGGAGKGTWLAYITACATGGRKWPDGSMIAQGPVNVLWIGTEDQRETVLRPRLVAAGADMEKVCIVPGGQDKLDDWDIGVFGNDKRILKAVQDGRFALVIVDPILRGAALNRGTNDDQGTRRLLALWQTLAREAQCAVIGVCHHAKYQRTRLAEGTPIDLVRGSAAITEVPRMVWQLTPDYQQDGASRILIVGKCNFTGPGMGRHIRIWAEEKDLGKDALGLPIVAGSVTDAIVEEGGWDTFKEGLLGKQDKDKGPSKKEQAKEAIRAYLGTKAKGRIRYSHEVLADAEAAVGCHKNTVREAAREMIADNELYQRDPNAKEAQGHPPKAKIWSLN